MKTDPLRAGSQAAAFIGKWRAREPEMAFAEVFCPPSQRTQFALWGALVLECREAALELSDPRPTQIKCLWWAEEATLAAQGHPRHPLTCALAQPALPWARLAQALATVADDDAGRPVDREAALATVAPLADALVAMEAALFVVPTSAPAQRAAAAHLLGQRLRIGREAGPGGRVPLALLARHGLTAAALAGPGGEPALRDWAGELAAALPRVPLEASLFRRARTGFDGWLLRERAAGRNRRMPPLRALLRAWTAARDRGPG
ncbi:MAG: hypothetical protein JSS44_13275 [Proteobacteria bacterium]|nr:hypothetical protein [Pseudomonadota bacterium]